MLKFTMGSTPEVKSGNLGTFIIMVRHKNGHEGVIPAYYLNEYPLEMDDGCDAPDCEDTHEDGCPHTGWFYDESNLDYQNCYYRIDAEVLAWSRLPTVDEVKSSISETI